MILFQHTAARRRLGENILRFINDYDCFNTQPPEGGWGRHQPTFPSVGHVSTHSRPKAAGLKFPLFFPYTDCFNTQPPEGGWTTVSSADWAGLGFQHTAARRRLERLRLPARRSFLSFNTQPPEGGWGLSQKPCSIRFRSPDFAKLPRKARTRV